MDNPIDDLDHAIIRFNAASSTLNHATLKPDGIKGVDVQRSALYGISQTAQGLSSFNNALYATYIRLDGLETLIKVQRKP